MLIGAVLLMTSAALSDPPAAARKDFELGGRKAFILVPASTPDADANKPWVWYAPTFNNNLPNKDEAWMFERLHARGIAVAGIDVGESYGNPTGRASFQKLYEEMTERRGYSKKPVLLARSRGGLMHYNWAVEHPDCVGGVAGIYPVCNLLSYPGLKKSAEAYKMTPEEFQAKIAETNPIERLTPLAKAKVAILHIHGDVDRLVPLDLNTAILAERYKALGGPIEVEIIKGGGHDLKRHWFESQKLTDFMIDKALAK